MFSWLKGMKAYIPQREEAECDQAVVSEAASMRSPRVATHSQGNNREPATREEDVHVSESVR